MSGQVGRALELLAAVGGLRSDPPVVSSSLAAEFRRRHLPTTRLAQFLAGTTEAGPRLEPATTRAAEESLQGLPAGIRHEVNLWLDELPGTGRRGRPHAATTVASYLRTVLPAARSWAERYTSLREVASDDVSGWVAPLTGSVRVGALVALRSLFKTLKSQRLIFTDPARGLRPGRFPQRPVLGLDPDTRSRLMSNTPAPTTDWCCCWPGSTP